MTERRLLRTRFTCSWVFAKASATIKYVELIRVLLLLSFFFLAIFILIEGFGNAAEIQTEAPAPEIGVIF